MEAVFLDYGTVSSGDLDASQLEARLPGLRLLEFTEDADIAGEIADAEVVLLNQLNLTRELIGGAARLALIALAATGTDNVDLAAARERGIAVCNVRGYCTPSVVQHVWAMILGITQRLPAIAAQRSSPDWWTASRPALPDPPIRELAGRTLGIVGWGELGAAVARIGESFGMRILIANRPGTAPRDGRLHLDEVLEAADVVSLHCPLTAATRGMIGARQLARMKADALLINTARGALIDGHALADALRAGRLGGAGIDVLPQEPPVHGDPLLEPGIPNLVVTPHIAWAAREARQRCLDEMALNIDEFRAGGNRCRVV